MFIVGDTPHDVACAARGAVPVAVATGSFSVEDLRRSGADLCFRTCDTAAVLATIDAAAGDIRRPDLQAQ